MSFVNFLDPALPALTVYLGHSLRSVPGPHITSVQGATSAIGSDSGPARPASNQSALDPPRRLFNILVLPDPQHPPPCRTQRGIRQPISLDVSIKLRLPPRGVRLWKGLMVRAPMPETSVDEHRQARRHEDDVGPRSWDAVDTTVNPESQTLPVKSRA